MAAVVPAAAPVAAPVPEPEAPVDPNDSKTVKLQSSDGTIFETTWAAAKKSNTVRNLVENMNIFETEGEPKAIPLPNVNDKDIKKVLAWLEQHRDEVEPEYKEKVPPGDKNFEFPEWDKAYFEIETNEIFQIILAANYLDIKRLLDFGCKKVASMIKGKTTEELRKTFNLPNDFTPEEEAQIQKENAWCDD